MTQEPVMYIAAIKLPAGKLAAQVAHAALGCYIEAKYFARREAVLDAWFAKGQAKIVVKLDDRRLQILDFAETHGIPLVEVHDAGRTVVEPGTLTAIAIGPLLPSEAGPLTTMRLY